MLFQFIFTCKIIHKLIKFTYTREIFKLENKTSNKEVMFQVCIFDSFS